jgi:hypothetical protein
MTRAFTATITALCIASSLALPVLADDATAADANATSTAASSTVTADANAATNVPNATAVADKTGADASSTTSTTTTDNNDKKSLADSTAPASPDAAATAPNGKTPAKPAKSAKGGATAALPARVAGFTAGVIVGTPICIIRRTHLEIKQGEHDLIGDVDTWWKKGLFVFPGLLMAVPYGGISGGVGGCMYSVRNAWQNSKDEPFSKDSFSLGDVGN